jgi:nucleotide-binding universal stress UspA family protein
MAGSSCAGLGDRY